MGVDAYPEHPHGIRANILFAFLRNRDYQPFAGHVHYPHYAKRSVWEKNWVFFSLPVEGSWGGYRLFAVYSIKPHIVLEFNPLTGDILEEFRTETPHPWTGGHLRGGCSPVRVGDEFYHFFHGRIGEHYDTIYNTGVYAFEATPPFRVTRMTRNPIQWANPLTRAGNTASVVFPCGAVYVPGITADGHDSKWLVSEGVNDRNVDVVTWDYDKIEDLMTAPTPRTQLKTAPVYVLYCEEFPDRKERILRHLHEKGIEPIFWRSIHGKSWGLQTNKVYVKGESPINAGQLGLVLGHYTLWQHLHMTGVEEAIILEDDAVLCDDFHARYDEITRNLPADADMCYIGHLGCKDRIAGRFGNNIVSLNFVPWATHAIMYRRTAFPVLLRTMAEARDPVDSQALWYNTLQPGYLKWYAARGAHRQPVECRRAHRHHSARLR